MTDTITIATDVAQLRQALFTNLPQAGGLWTDTEPGGDILVARVQVEPDWLYSGSRDPYEVAAQAAWQRQPSYIAGFSVKIERRDGADITCLRLIPVNL